jgi:hypothetical protein
VHRIAWSISSTSLWGDGQGKWFEASPFERLAILHLRVLGAISNSRFDLSLLQKKAGGSKKGRGCGTGCDDDARARGCFWDGSEGVFRGRFGPDSASGSARVWDGLWGGLRRGRERGRFGPDQASQTGRGPRLL